MRNHFVKLSIFAVAILWSVPVFAKPKCGETTKISGKDTIVETVDCYKEGGWEIQRMCNSQLDGWQEGFYPDGKKLNTSYFLKGIQENIQKGWAPDGFLTVYKPYKNGHPIDTHKLWYDNKKLQSQDVYDTAGTRKGWSMKWAENGVLLDSTLYAKGEMIEAFYFWKSGKLMLHEKTKGNKETGSYDILSGTSFDSTGKKNGEVKDGNGRLIVLRSRENIAIDTITVKNSHVQSASYFAR